MNSSAGPRRGLEYKWKVLISVIFGIFMIIIECLPLGAETQQL